MALARLPAPEAAELMVIGCRVAPGHDDVTAPRRAHGVAVRPVVGDQAGDYRPPRRMRGLAEEKRNPGSPAASPHPPKWNSRSLKCAITYWALVPFSCDGCSIKTLVKALGLLVAASSEKYCCVPTAYSGPAGKGAAQLGVTPK
jgi:hypothetical protein